MAGSHDRLFIHLRHRIRNDSFLLGHAIYIHQRNKRSALSCAPSIRLSFLFQHQLNRIYARLPHRLDAGTISAKSDVLHDHVLLYRILDADYDIQFGFCCNTYTPLQKRSIQKNIVFLIKKDREYKKYRFLCPYIILFYLF